MTNGCRYYALSLTPTEAFGSSLFWSRGNTLQPITVGFGVAKNLAVSTSLTDFNVNLGVGTGLPISASIRVYYAKLTEKDYNGCPCPDSPGPSVIGSAVNGEPVFW